MSPDGRHVYVSSAFSGSISTFDRNSTSGLLVYNAPSSVQSSSISGLNLMGNEPPRCLSSADACKDSGYGIPMRGLSAMAVSKDGQHVYATSNQDSALLTFDRDNATGALTRSKSPIFDGDMLGASVVDGLAGASGVLVSENDLSVYVTGARDQAVAAFDRDPGSGSLTYADRVKNGERRFDQFVLEPPDDLNASAARPRRCDCPRTPGCGTK